MCAHEDASWVVTKEPTCTEAGSKSLICSACDAVLETKEIPAIGHDWVWHVETETCCCKPGFEVPVCANCGEHGTGREIAALEHLPGDAVKENYKAATYTEWGYYDWVVYCQRECCGAELSRDRVDLQPLDYPDEPNTGDFTVALGMVLIVVMMVPCLLISKFRAVK